MEQVKVALIVVVVIYSHIPKENVPLIWFFYCLVFRSFFIKMERSVNSANIFGVSALLENRQDILNKQTLDQINYLLENIVKFD